MQSFTAIDNGTVATKRIPYLFLEKGKKIDLTDEEATFYLKSKWLRPTDEVNGRPVPPLMSHTMNIVKKSPVPPSALPASATMTPGYNSNMDALLKKEAAEDGKPIEQAVAAQNAAAAESKIETGGGTAQAGTGNQEVC